MSLAAPCRHSAALLITTLPGRTCGWMEPQVPTRMMVRMPTWTSSLTTMLSEGAPIPLVAESSGRPLGKRPT